MAQSDRPLQRVVLTGGGVRAGDVAGRLALLVGVPVEAGTVRGLDAPERALGSGDWADLTVAAGLALGGSRGGGWHIDLCPPQKRKLQFDRQLATRLGAVAAVLVVSLGGLTVKSVLTIRQTRHQLSAQQKVVRGVEAELARYDSLRRLNADLDAGRKRVQTALGGDVSWTRFLSDFVQAMPDGVWIQSLSAQTNGSALGGAKPSAAVTRKSARAAAGPTGIGSVAWTVTGLDYPQAADWLRDLKEDPALAAVTVGSVAKSELGGRSVVLFNSTATLTPEARSDRAARLATAAL